MAENYRGLSIIATISKVLSAIIVERSREAYEYVLLRSQFGFLANRSTTGAIYIYTTSTTREHKESKRTNVYSICGLKSCLRFGYQEMPCSNV